MDDQILPQPIGGSAFPPVQLSPQQEELCARLDELHTQHGLRARPSDMYKGAVFVARTELRENSDWIAQAANSLRDILYPFGNSDVPNREEALRQFGSVAVDGQSNRDLGRIFGLLTELAHHGNGRGNSVDFMTYSGDDFSVLLSDFERVMLEVLMRQVDVHNEVDALLVETSDIGTDMDTTV